MIAFAGGFMKVSFFTKILVLIACAVLLVACEIKEQHYSTWEKMSQAPANQLTWIPSFMLQEEALVQNIHSIVECHDLDSNKGWGKAECNETALAWLQSLSFQEQQLDKTSWKFLSKLGLKNQQVQIAQLENWQIILEGSTFYYYGE